MLKDAPKNKDLVLLRAKWRGPKFFVTFKYSSSYDASKKDDYVPRSQRKEWDAVGLMGKLRMLKGQPTGDRWIKMRDVSDTVEEWLVR